MQIPILCSFFTACTPVLIARHVEKEAPEGPAFVRQKPTELPDDRKVSALNCAIIAREEDLNPMHYIGRNSHKYKKFFGIPPKNIRPKGRYKKGKGFRH